MQTGLTTAEAEELYRSGKGNTPPVSNTRTIPQIIRKNLFTYFNLIYLVLTVMVIAAGSFKSLTFLPAVLANTLIGTIQEISAKRTIDRLTLMNEATIPTIRDGEEAEIPMSRLVLGDVVILRAGMQIPADAKVLDGELYVNESLLTGEADEIEKQTGSELLSGSFAVGGECRAVLTKVGDDAYASRLIREARAIGGSGQSEMVRDINHIILFAGIAGQYRIGGGSSGRHDPARADIAVQHSPCHQRSEACQTQGASARHAKCGDPCQSGRTLCRQNRHHHGRDDDREGFYCFL